jgi:hypothetical protein
MTNIDAVFIVKGRALFWKQNQELPEIRTALTAFLPWHWQC